MTLLNDQQPRPRNRRRRPSYPRRIKPEALALVAACSVTLMACDGLFPGTTSGDMVGPYHSGGYGGEAGNAGGGGDGGEAGNAGGYGGEAGGGGFGGEGGEVGGGGFGGEGGEGEGGEGEGGEGGD